jgi:L-alanine-DL-glutamate epimerase-like enolase superfamily enzyme
MSDVWPAISRRRFLQGAAVAASTGLSAAAGRAGELPAKIDRIDVFPFRYPLAGYFKFLARGRGRAGRAAVIVKVTADEGTVGWGQSLPVETWSYETLEAATIVLREYYAPDLIGHDPTDIAGAHRIMDQAVAPAFSTGMPITRAGIDIALHDLTGKLLGKSLCQMWEKSPGGPITLSWTVNPRRLDEVGALMDEGRRRGYRNFNIKVAPDPKFDVQLARRVRQEAPDAFLWADANGGYDTQTALETAPQLADAGVDVLEAPLKPNRISGYQALKRQGALPILMDEGVVSPVELAEFIRLEMLDGVAMKPSRCGGLVSNKRQIELVEEAGLMWLGSGLMDPDISLAATLGLYGAFGLQKPAALNGPQFLTADVLAKPLRIEGDQAHVPTGPGLGIEVDEAKVIELMEQAKRAAD